MLVATGYFDAAGNPCLKVHLAGVFVDTPGIEFGTIIDTGFSGFLAIPIVRAFPLGLPLNGTASAVLADGNTSTCLTALCRLTIGKQTKEGLVMLQAQGTDLLLGMDFIRKFKLSMMMTKSEIILLDEDAIDQLRKDVQATPKSAALPAPVASASSSPPNG